MGLFDTLNIEHLIERAMEHIDVASITKDAMKDLIIAGEDMYFVVRVLSDHEVPDFLGMAYSKKSALGFSKKKPGSKVIRLDLGRLVALAEAVGATEEVT